MGCAMKPTHHTRLPKWLLNPDYLDLVKSIGKYVEETQSFAGRTIREFDDAIEERIRNEEHEVKRKLRVEVAALIIEGSEIDLPHGVLPSELRVDGWGSEDNQCVVVAHAAAAGSVDGRGRRPSTDLRPGS